MTTTTTPVDTTHEQNQLAQAFRFNNDDLQHNRDGTLTDEQKRRLRRRRVVSGEMGLAVVVGIHLVVFIIGSTVGAYRTVALGAPSGVIIPIMIIVLCVWGLTVFTRPAIRQWRNLSQDARDGQVKVLQGPVERRWLLVRRNRFPHIATDDGQVQVTARQQALFIPGQCYALYVVPHSGVLLSAEKLDE